MKLPNAFEKRILDTLLLELRRAMRARAQLSIIIDPFTRGGGAHISALPNETGRTYEFTKDPEPKRKRG